jgi:hypothetical protein
MPHLRSALVASLLLLSPLGIAQDLPEPVNKLHRFIGVWKGFITFEILDLASGDIMEFGIEGNQNCQTDAKGYSINCAGVFMAIGSNPFFETFEESIQGGYSVPDAKIVWAYVYSTGEAGALAGNWNGDKLELTRTFEREGITFTDVGSWIFTSNDTREFLAETRTPDGTVVRRIFGTLRK